MKYLPKILIFFWILAFPKFLISQNENLIPCGTHSPTPFEYDFIKNHIANLPIPENSTITWIPIKVHVVLDNNGNSGITQSDINKGIANLNHYFLEADIGFYFCGESPNYINEAIFYEFIESQENDLAAGNEVTNSINLFFVNSITSNDGNSNICGYAYTPSIDILKTTRVLMKNDCTLNAPNGTLVHEFGHFFSLLHTHNETENGNNDPEAENVDRFGLNKNCDSNGDLLCDTDADPRYNPDLFDLVNCLYNGSQVDAIGIPYMPPIDNIMSYYPDSCGGIFTFGQYGRIKQGLMTRQGHTSYSLDCPPTDVANPSNLTATSLSDDIQLSWQDNSNNEFGFIIERSSQSSNSGFKALKNGGVAPDVTSFLDTDILPNVNYWYRVRASNDGGDEYSDITSLFNSTGQITYLEYFLDTDPGYLLGNEIAMVPSDNIEQEVTVDLSNLNSGIHNLYIRCKNDLDKWSFTQKQTFFIIPALTNNNIFGLEYYVDNDPGYGLGTTIPITSGADITESFSINLNNLSPGIHNLYIRAKNEFGQWSFNRIHTFYIGLPLPEYEIVEIEYFIDLDPGIGNGISLPVTPSSNNVTLNFEIDLDIGLSSGEHILCTRAKNESGVWSDIECDTFEIISIITALFTVDNPSICLGEEVTFSNSSINADSFYWSFGNGEISLESQPSIIYDVPGTYDVSLIATNTSSQNSDTLVLVDFITVYQNPVVNILGDDKSCEDPITLDAGSGFVTYEWSNNSQEQTLLADITGVYNVTISDDNGCTGSDGISIEIFSNPQPIIIGDGNFCLGSSAILEVDNNFFEYTWSDGSGNQTLEIMNEATYAVTVTDINGCTGSDEIITTFYPLPMAIIQPQDTAICEGQVLELTASGGIDYLWSTNSMESSVIVSDEGIYSVTVSDVNGCEDVASFNLAVEQPPSIIDQIIGNANCGGEGFISVFTQNSTDQFIWDNGFTGNEITGLTPGMYTVTITNDFGCSLEETFEISGTNALELEFEITNVSCFGADDGIISVTPIGGAPPFSFIWNPASNMQQIENLEPGFYGVSVSDCCGCVANEILEITEPDKLLLNLEMEGDSASVNPEGGVPPYDIIWSNGETGLYVNGLNSGMYFVTVTDSNGCEEVEGFTDVKDIPTLKTLEIFPNPTNQFLNLNASFSKKQKGEINIYNLLGQKMETTIFNTTIIQTQFDLSKIASGTYFLEIKTKRAFV